MRSPIRDKDAQQPFGETERLLALTGALVRGVHDD